MGAPSSAIMPSWAGTRFGNFVRDIATTHDLGIISLNLDEYRTGKITPGQPKSMTPLDGVPIQQFHDFFTELAGELPEGERRAGKAYFKYGGHETHRQIKWQVGNLSLTSLTGSRESIPADDLPVTLSVWRNLSGVLSLFPTVETPEAGRRLAVGARYFVATNYELARHYGIAPRENQIAKMYGDIFGVTPVDPARSNYDLKDTMTLEDEERRIGAIHVVNLPQFAGVPGGASLVVILNYGFERDGSLKSWKMGGGAYVIDGAMSNDWEQNLDGAKLMAMARDENGNPLTPEQVYGELDKVLSGIMFRMGQPNEFIMSAGVF